MTKPGTNVGVLDSRFLSRSVGALNPTPPLTLAEDGWALDAVKILQDHRIGCVVIVDRTGKLKGIFSERDAVLKLLRAGVGLAGTPITKVMTPNPKTIQMTTPIAHALNLMSAGGYRHMPIIDDEGIPVGIISIKDIVDHIAATVTSHLTSLAV